MKKYHKRINISDLSESETRRLIKLIHLMSYGTQDYKINYYGTDKEMIITNRDLHKDLKIIRKTSYHKQSWNKA